ncbi:hypothetical protein [Streptomyces sp. ODS28]|uniref:hypothetical protein n=1 Tax=Streptomyces sp. ODS28 TaxID=3136688 RepID=UPI0031EF5FE1
MDANLSSLLDASTAWKGMGKRFGELAADYKTRVMGTADSKNWKGVAAKYAKISFETTHEEYLGAQQQANAVGKILEQAYSDLHELKKEVERACREAREKGKMRVTENGHCVLELDRIEDPDEREDLSRNSAKREKLEDSWAHTISESVKKAAKRDQEFKVALFQVTKDADGRGVSGGFNSKASGDVDANLKSARSEAVREARKRKEQWEENSWKRTLIKGVNTGVKLFTKNGWKPDTTALDAAFKLAGLDKTEGVVVNVSGGLVVGGNVELGLVRTQNPDGTQSLGFVRSAGVDSAGWTWGASGGIGTIRSNADDIDQLSGTGWNKGGSLHLGVGAFANHENAIDTYNSKGDAVQSVRSGVGIGLGNEINTGFGHAGATEIWRSKK